MLRESVQVVERVLHFKRAMAEISNRISRYAQELTGLEEIKNDSKLAEPLDHIITSSSMQNRIIESM